MGWWPWGKKNSMTPLSLDEMLRDQLGAAAAKAGVRVTWRTALEAVTATACAKVIAEDLAQIPFRLFRNDGVNRLPASDHALYDLLDTAPNEFQTTVEFRETLGMHLVFCGNAFVFKVRSPRGHIVELLPFEPQHVTVTKKNWTLTYSFSTEEGSRIDVPASDVWHLRGPSWNGWMGLDGVRLAREAIGLAVATEEHGARLFSNGATPGGLLSTDRELNKEQRDALRASWESRQAGAQNAYKTAVLWGGMKWTPLGGQSDQMQFLETRKFQVEEVCRAFRVMPIVVGYSDKNSTYASAEQMFQAHVKYTMGPWYSRLEKSANKNLLTAEERAAGLYFKFVTNGLLRGDAASRAAFYTALYNIGAINPNEIRDLEDMNPYEGGDQYRVPLNMEDPNSPDDEGDENVPRN